MINKSDNIRREYTSVEEVGDYEILTDTGWSDIANIMVTPEYEVWEIKTPDYSLKCADDHIVFLEDYSEIFTKDLKPGDIIITETGLDEVISCESLGYSEIMYDLAINDDNHRMYTNGILSHNSMVLGNCAARSFLAGNNTGLVTVELADRSYMKRIGSNILNITKDEYENINDETQMGLVSKRIQELKDSGKNIGHLEIVEFPTGGATAIDIENYFLRLETKLNRKFKVIVVDYLNLLKPIKDQAGLYEKVKCICEELRGVAMRNEWCVISATQIRRDDVDNFDLGMDSVAESFGLVHTVDALYGLMRSPLEGRMKIKVIANRDNGYEESYKFYAMNKDHFRLEEESGMNSEYYSDDDSGAGMVDQVRAEMNHATQPQMSALTDNSGIMSKTTAEMPDDDYDALFSQI